MTDTKAKEPVRAVANITRIMGPNDAHTIARASVSIHPDEPTGQQARRLREATLRDLRRTTVAHSEGFYEGLASLVENEASFAISEAQAGRVSNNVATIVDGIGMPGTRFKWMTDDGEGLAVVSIQLVTRGEEEASDGLLSSIIAA